MKRLYRPIMLVCFAFVAAVGWQVGDVVFTNSQDAWAVIGGIVGGIPLGLLLIAIQEGKL